MRFSRSLQNIIYDTLCLLYGQNLFNIQILNLRLFAV